MKTEDLYASQTSLSDMSFNTVGSVDVTSFIDAIFPINTLLVVFLFFALCYGFYRREKWGTDQMK